MVGVLAIARGVSGTVLDGSTSSRPFGQSLMIIESDLSAHGEERKFNLFSILKINMGIQIS
jgi:hypothetical protein